VVRWLADAEDRAVSEAIDALIATGPSLGRPFVDTLSSSHVSNLEESRPKRNDIRIIFVFDPRRMAMQNQHVTQQELATALGVSQVNVSRIERADEPQLSTMRRFIEALGGELIVQARIDGETFDLLTTEQPSSIASSQ